MICQRYFIKKKLIRLETDSDLLNQIKSLFSACLNFYIKKYNVFNNVFLIAATYLDPWTKDFNFSMNLSNESPTEYIRKAKSFLLKRDKEIIRPQMASEKPSNNKRESGHGKTCKDPFEKEFKSFCGRSVAEENEPEVLISKLELELILYDSIQLKCESHRSEFWKKYEGKLPKNCCKIIITYMIWNEI